LPHAFGIVLAFPDDAMLEGHQLPFWHVSDRRVGLVRRYSFFLLADSRLGATRRGIDAIGCL
jgi:hypothetical protein